MRFRSDEAPNVSSRLARSRLSGGNYALLPQALICLVRIPQSLPPLAVGDFRWPTDVRPPAVHFHVGGIAEFSVATSLLPNPLRPSCYLDSGGYPPWYRDRFTTRARSVNLSFPIHGEADVSPGG